MVSIVSSVTSSALQRSIAYANMTDFFDVIERTLGDDDVGGTTETWRVTDTLPCTVEAALSTPAGLPLAGTLELIQQKVIDLPVGNYLAPGTRGRIRSGPDAAASYVLWVNIIGPFGPATNDYQSRILATVITPMVFQ